MSTSSLSTFACLSLLAGSGLLACKERRDNAALQANDSSTASESRSGFAAESIEVLDPTLSTAGSVAIALDAARFNKSKNCLELREYDDGRSQVRITPASCSDAHNPKTTYPHITLNAVASEGEMGGTYDLFLGAPKSSASVGSIMLTPSFGWMLMALCTDDAAVCQLSVDGEGRIQSLTPLSALPKGTRAGVVSHDASNNNRIYNYSNPVGMDDDLAEILASRGYKVDEHCWARLRVHHIDARVVESIKVFTSPCAEQVELTPNLAMVFILREDLLYVDDPEEGGSPVGEVNQFKDGSIVISALCTDRQRSACKLNLDHGHIQSVTK